MPNQIWIVRHAKSSWADANMRDHDRPLNERGNHDAPRMADLILNQIQDNLLLFSSTALRAKTTCEIFANTFKTKIQQFGFQKNYITLPNLIYCHISMN